MAFKSKILPEQVAELDFKSYLKLLKKEVPKAAKFGETEVVVLSDHQYKDNETGTLLLWGKFSGPLARFYKEAKKNRSKEKDFARGKCQITTDEAGKTLLKIALEDGKAKPNRLQKNGKQLFKKLGVEVEIIKGAFAEEETIPTFSDEEREIHQQFEQLFIAIRKID